MLINYQHVDINQQEHTVLSDVNFQLNEGEFIYLIGKVGSGKTSLLKSFYKELNVNTGTAEVLGHSMLSIKTKQIPALRRQLGIVFQDFQLLTDRTVYENLEFVLQATQWKKQSEIQERIQEVLKMVGMETKGYKLPHELSGGEQQRIVLARAILNSPKIILADEPTGNLDEETGRQIIGLLRAISTKGAAVVMTTHNLNLVREFPGIVYKCEGHQIIEYTKEFYSQQINNNNK